MKNSTGSKSNENFLIEEYKRYAEAFWKNEEIGEKRLNYFLTLTTAIIAAVTTLLTSKTKLVGIGEATVFQISTAALAGIFLFGLVTFFRMLQRDHVTDEYKAILDYLRDRITRAPDEPKDYSLPFRKSRHWLLRGSLSMNVAVMNSIILAIIPAIWLTGGYKWIGICTIFTVSFIVHTRGIKARKNEP